MKMSSILALKTVCEKIKNEKLPINTVYRLAKLCSSIDEEFSFYQSSFQKIIDAYGLKDENGQYMVTDDGTGIKIQPKFIPNAEKELTELQNIEVTLPNIKFKLKELENLQLTVDEIYPLMDFIEVDEKDIAQ